MKKLIIVFVVVVVIGVSFYFYNDYSKAEREYQNFKREQAIQDSLKKDEAFKIEMAKIEEAKQDSLEQLKIKSYNIKLISGKHKYGGSTKLEYSNYQQLIQEAEKESISKMWSESEKQSRLEFLNKYGIGGKLVLHIDRTSIETANLILFKIIIKDNEDNEITRIGFDSKIPKTPIGEYWWNTAIKYIDKRLNAPFYIYVVDAIEDAPFKFEVTPVYK